ncbi:type VI secretion system tip protein TssI/VgrG [Sorangium sp. So ce281]|uniref:type VI secretion system Vgr family protein n=1 Tax=unclassified Sorangium TaxID=2621164 RepID=UPI003F5EA1BC
MSFIKTSSDDATQSAGEAALGKLATRATGKGKELDGGATPDVAADLPFFEAKAITSSIPKGAVSSSLGRIAGEIGGAVARRLSGSNNLELNVSSKDRFDVRQFSVHDRMSSLFQIDLVALSENPSIDFDEVVGQPARFALDTGTQLREWTGICNHIELTRVEPDGLSTYQVSVVPTLWLLTQRRNYRIFQQISEPDIVLKILAEWNIEPKRQYDAAAYKKRKYRVQYAESDFTFISRMLEDAGIAYYFEQTDEGTRLVLSDAAHANPRREGSLSFLDDATLVRDVGIKFVTAVRMSQQVRPGKVTLRDHDYRRPPGYKLMATASGGKGIEERLERFQYVPGAFLFGADQGEATPVADDKGKTRTDEREAARLAQQRLDAERGSSRLCTFDTNAHDLAPGVVVSFDGHPHAAIGDAKPLLVIESSLRGTDRGEWSHHCKARGTDVPFRPEHATPRPTVSGVESATVVGPPGEEIHTDEFGRVRVHFHWDRESNRDDNSSCWIHVSQPWSGAGYGGSSLPRVGQEVLVDFLGGDPDRPVIVGRIYTGLQKTPYKLPENKTQSGWKSNSTGGGGGYNELMFEDAQGKELLRMQAEKDLAKLVKNDESVTIGNDRTKSVGHDDTHTVGNDRSRVVGNNESVTIGVNQTITVGADQTATVGGDQRVTVTGSQFNTVKGQPAQGGFQGSHTDVTGNFKVTASDTAYVSAPNKITLECQGSSITLEPGKITIKAGGNAQIVLDANAKMTSNAGSEALLDANAKMHSSTNSDLILDANAKLRSSGSSEVFLDAKALVQGSGGGNTLCDADVRCSGQKATISSTEGGSAEFTADATVSGANVSISGAAKVGIAAPAVSSAAAGTNEISGGMVKIN